MDVKQEFFDVTAQAAVFIVIGLLFVRFIYSKYEKKKDDKIPEMTEIAVSIFGRSTLRESVLVKSPTGALLVCLFLTTFTVVSIFVTISSITSWIMIKKWPLEPTVKSIDDANDILVFSSMHNHTINLRL